MSSFNAVNYSLRPSKAIQRRLIFQGIQELQRELALERQVYIGLGSIWFTDFIIAHQVLRIDDMVSIEADDVGYMRARFNSPYATVRVIHGESSKVLTALYEDRFLEKRPWIIWLDYDYQFDETTALDILSIIENAPQNTVIIITFNGHNKRYGNKPEECIGRIRTIFGAVVPDDLDKSACRGEQIQATLAHYAILYMQSVASEMARPGGFIPAFRVIYRDNAPMVTVGGVLPAKGAVRSAASIVSAANWPCTPTKPIVAPHLTIREASMLQSLLPAPDGIDRAKVRSLGFDLADEQIEAFQTYYRHYPYYAQIGV